MKMNIRLAGLLTNGKQPDLFIDFALHFVTHPSLLITDTIELSVVHMIAYIVSSSQRVYILEMDTLSKVRKPEGNQLINME